MIVTGKETGIRSLFYMMILLHNKSRLPFVSSIHNMKKIAVAITGASGSIYAKLLLEKLSALHEQIAELSIVLTDNAKEVWRTELRDETFHDFKARYFTTKDFSAPFASGSAKYDALLIAPCSMGTLGRIAAGISNDLISRAADVMLKERKKLILLVRDTPYNLIHIKNMETVTLAGGIICPASPSFYSRPQTIEAAAATVVDRAIDLTGLDSASFRWGT
jgi:4-hydroxy-3-polyprenylbenzoate decarboxylase